MLVLIEFLFSLFTERQGDFLVHLRNRRDGLHLLLLPAVPDGQPVAGDLRGGGLRARLLSAAHGGAVGHQHFNHHSVSNC